MQNNKRKIPGMFYILFSFIPWIVYWVLCGMGYVVGIVFSLIISLFLIISQIYRRDFNLMDLVSVFYFGLASLGTFVFNLEIFLEKSGFLGYSALFLMAIFSLIIKQPFTFQVSKKDYPKIYWKDKAFLAINSAITGTWAIIFVTNAIIFLFFNLPLNVIFSNILIGFGIAFSIIFPLKVPIYFAVKEFKKYDWKVETNPQKQKKEDEYDVIIIGSGIAGLTCGALLSKRGYKVLVLEQHYQVGGYCSSFQREGFVFNSGVENVSGLWEKGPLTYFLKELGFKKEDFFIKNNERFIFKNKEINIPSTLEGFINLLSEMFPNEKENIFKFFKETKKAYEECYQEAEIYGIPLPPYLIVKTIGEEKLRNYPKDHPHFYDWLNKTYKQKLDEYFRDENLKTLLCVFWGHIGTKAEKTPANNALVACLSYFLYGGYFTKGGAQNFADSLKKFIENHDGQVLVNHKVDKILIKNKVVGGVKIKEEIFKSPVVVANANAKTTFLELVEENNLSKEFVEYIKELKMSPSCFMVFLGLDIDLSNYPTLIKNLDEEYAIVINSNADSTLAPKGKSSLSLITFANYDEFPKRETKEYLKKKEEFARALIKKAEKIIPDLSKHIIVQDAATPKTFERYTLMPRGALYSFDQSVGIKRPYFKTPIKDLYLTGASTFPGGGIEATVISGIICANDICDWKIRI